MPLGLPNRYHFARTFADFEELSESIRAWDLDFRQLDAGESPAILEQIGYDGALLTHASFNRRYDQRGAAPPGTRTFALLNPGVRGVIWCGREVTDRTLLMFDASGSFEGVSQPGFSVFTFSLPQETLVQVGQVHGIGAPEDLAYGGDNAIDLTPSMAHALRARMAQIKQAVNRQPGVLAAPRFADEVTCHLPNHLLRIIESSKETPGQPTLRARHIALKKAVDYIKAATDQTINVSDLCRITGASERTLEYAFKEQYGVSPKRYLLRYRLNLAHKVLFTAAPREVTVTDVANRFGFWHMGQFAADYRRLFGRLPSSTLQKR